MIRLVSEIPKEARGWRNGPGIAQWCRQHTLLSIADHEKWLKKIEDDPSIKMYGIERGDGKSLGVCGFTSINMLSRSAEFSLYIGREHWRNGFGSEALKRLVDHGFRAFGFNRIWGETFESNPAIKTFEKLGMVKEGTLRETYFKDGKFIDSHIYSILAKDWL